MSSGGVLLEFCDISVSSYGIDMAEEGYVLYLPVVSGARVLLSWRDCSGVLSVVFFSVDSLRRVKFGEKDESGGCRREILIFCYLCVFVCSF